MDNHLEVSARIREKAPLILVEIKKASSILLHCHPSPDPDSVASALAMKFALEQLGKKSTVIRGDSAIPDAFKHFPGAADIVEKNYLEIDTSKYDLFIALDSGDTARISSRGKVEFPFTMKVVNIDHHISNPNFGQINLVESAYPATAQILFDLFKEWKISLDPNIAMNLLMGIYTDTGGFAYEGTTVRTFLIASELIRYAPEFPHMLSEMKDSNTPEFLAFEALALNSIETFFEGKLALSVVSNEALRSKNIPMEEASSSAISPILKSVIGWDIVAALIEVEPNKVKCSFRTRNANTYDVAKLTQKLGGGGHKAAAGATLVMPIQEAKDLVVRSAKELYNL